MRKVKIDFDSDCPAEVIDMRRLLEEGIGKLGYREGRVLRMRYGLDGAAHTLREIAVEFGVTVGRIRQIEEKGLKKLARRKKVFAGYVEGVGGEEREMEKERAVAP